MKKLNFEVYDQQACLLYWKKDGQMVIVLLYVDDIVVTGNNKDKIRETQRRLCDEFKMKVLGEPKQFLGIEIHRDKNKIELKQTKFIEAMVKKRVHCVLETKFHIEKQQVLYYIYQIALVQIFPLQ